MSNNPNIIETHKRSIVYHYSAGDLEQLLIERVAKLNGFTLGGGTQGQVKFEQENGTGNVKATVMIEQDMLYVAPAAPAPWAEGAERKRREESK